MTKICSFYIDSVHFDLATCLVKCDERAIEINLDARSMELMLCLAKGGIKGCSRDELLTVLWPNKVVSDDSLTNLVSQTRAKLKVFTDSYIKTVPKKGYILVGDIVFDTTQSQALQQTQATPPSNLEKNISTDSIFSSSVVEQHAAGKGFIYRFKWILIVVLIAFATLSKVLLFPNSTKVDRTIAILPIQAFTEDPQITNGAASFTDELVHQFANYPGIYIVSRLEAEQVSKTSLSLQEMSSKMQARYLVDGSVREIDGNIKITVQLIDGVSGLNIFSRVVNASKQKFVSKTEKIIQVISRLVISEMPTGLAQHNKSKFSPKVIQAKCESYLGLASLYADMILQDIDSIAAPAENACISLAQIKFGDADAESKIAELYVKMAIATMDERNEKLSFINLAYQYLAKANESDDQSLNVFSVRAQLQFLEIEDALNNGKNNSKLFDGALDNLKTGLSYFPQSLSLLNSKGEIYRNIGVSKRRHGVSPVDDFIIAEEAFSKVIAIDNNNEIVWEKMARLQMSTAAYFNDIGQSPIEKLQESANSYQKAIDINPKKPGYYLKKANVLMVIGDLLAEGGKASSDTFKKSAQSLQTASEISPNLFGTEAALADLYRRMAKVDFNHGIDASEIINKGIKHGRRAIELNPTSVWSYFALMELYRTGYQLDFAKGMNLSSYGKQCIDIGNLGMAIKKDSARAWVSLLDCEQLTARIYVEQNEMNAAKQKLQSLRPLIENLIALDKNYSFSYQIRGNNQLLLAIANASNDFSDAIKSYQNSVKLNSSSSDRKFALVEAYLYQHKVNGGLESKSSKEINNLFDELSQAEPNSAELKIQQAILAMLKGTGSDLKAISKDIVEKFSIKGDAILRKYQYFLDANR